MRAESRQAEPDAPQKLRFGGNLAEGNPEGRASGRGNLTATYPPRAKPELRSRRYAGCVRNQRMLALIENV